MKLLDQRLLPRKVVWLHLKTWQEVRDAIHDMAVRGAPAIGVAAAYGMALASAKKDIKAAHLGLAESRPTAVNLVWALDRIAALPRHDFETVVAEAQKIEKEDHDLCRKIGTNGVELVPDQARILTICNTGSLATAGEGTALAIVRRAHVRGKLKHVWACETRPRQQGLRLTAWELLHDGIPFHSIADSAAASLMKAGQVNLVVAGADRIAANGDTANKIGTYSLAVLANHHTIPFVIAAPSSTLDPTLPDGSFIPIELRSADELTECEGIRIAPDKCPVYNPAFDVTPGELITAIVTETGIHKGPYGFLSDKSDVSDGAGR